MNLSPLMHLEYLHPIGEIIGIQVGSTYKSREEVRLARLHRPPMAGISYISDGPAESIVVSGGYEDDEDFGETIIYTGQGGQESGKQVKDQEVTRGNKALIFSEDHGSPVRIIRGAGGDPKFSPKSGYRYDGVYQVTKHWFEKSKFRPLVIKFELNRISEPVQPSLSNQMTGSAPIGNAQPERKSVTSSPIKRDSAVSDWVKKVHKDRCQFCGITLVTRVGTYSTGAHIQGLGKPHYGKDETSNLLCLCPNCHVLFDKGVLYIANDNLTLVNIVSGDKTQISVHVNHELDRSAIAHHRLKVAGIED
jgi:putative restriction endonuclease